MLELKQTETFRKWRANLKDHDARARIASRLDRLVFGNPGDVRPAGNGISEMRIDYGPGYRLYFKKQGDVFVILLCGGSKKTQSSDIATVHRLAKQWSEQDD